MNANSRYVSVILALAITFMRSPRARKAGTRRRRRAAARRMGRDDERVAANLQTPQTVLKATRMIREGKVYTGSARAVDSEIRGALLQPQPLRAPRPHGRNQQRGTKRRVHALGQIGTQFDGLAHQGGCGPHLYNLRRERCVAARTASPSSAWKNRRAVHARGDARYPGAEGCRHPAGHLRDHRGRPRGTMSASASTSAPGGGAGAHPAGPALRRQTRYHDASRASRRAGMAGGEERHDVGSDTGPFEVRPFGQGRPPGAGCFLVVKGIFLLENLDLEACRATKVHEFASSCTRSS